MKLPLPLSLLASVFTLNAMASDAATPILNEGRVSGQFREFSISREVDNTAPVANNDYTRRANAIGGYLKYETPTFSGLSAGVAAYGTIGVAIGDNRSITNREIDPTLLSTNNRNDIYLGEAYLHYKNGATTFKGGRQKLDTPMAGSDDARMIPNLFEAYVLSNTDIKNTTLIAAHVTKFAQGTFGQVYDARASKTGGLLSVTSGYSLIDSRNQTGDFTNMGTYAIGDSTAGVSVAAAIYTGVKGLKLQVWDYYAHDILNAIYGEANYGVSLSNGVAPYLAAQWISERDVGSNSVITKVNSDFVGAKMGVKVADFDINGAVSHNSKDASVAIGGGTISPWGGMPAYTQGMVMRHQFMAGTDAWKVAANYNWKTLGINLNTGVYHAEYIMDKLNGYSPNYEWTAKESGFDIIFVPESIKQLQLRLRANYADDFLKTATGSISWDEYRFIANYSF